MNEPIRVLLVDDEESFWKEMSKRLTPKGFQVEVATSGPEALAKAQACGGNFHVAVIDQVMGPPNGIEIMLQLREQYPVIEAIILTGWGDMEPGKRAMELGAYRYMSKSTSYNVDELALNIELAARLGRERQRRLALQALVQAGQRISGAQSEEELYQLLYEQAQELLPELGGFLVSHYDEQNQVVSFPFYRVRGECLSLPVRKNGNGITEFVLRQKEPLLLPDGDKDFRQKHGLQPPLPEEGYCSSEVIAPMFLAAWVLGTIAAMTYNPNVHYTQEHLGVLQAFANQAAMAIQNVQQLEDARQLRDAVAALAAQQGKEAVLQTIIAEAHRLIGSDVTGLVLQDENGTLRMVRPLIPEGFDAEFGEPRQQGGVIRAVIEKREPVVILDTSQEPLVKEEVWQAGIRSVLAMPLIHEDRVLGVLYANTFELRYFSQHDVSLWSAFAAQAAAALYSALEEEREIEDSRRLVHALGTLTGKLSLREAMSRVATAAKTIFQADTCRLAYVDPSTGRILAWGWADGDPEAYRYEGEPRPDGVTYHVLQTKKPVFRSDADTQVKPFPPPAFLEQGLKSFASLPLVHGERVTGVLHCNYLKRRRPFSERDQTLFEAFSARAAMALDRARRDQMNEVWQELDRQIPTCSDLKTLYTLFADHSLQALHADFAIFYPYDPTTMPESLLAEDCVPIGNFLTPWQRPQDGLGGGVHRALDQARGELLVVNDLDGMGGQLRSRLVEREGVKAFVALRLEVAPEGQTEPRLAGMLFLNFRKAAAFEPADLVGLRLAGGRVAAAIMRLHLLSALQKQWEQRNRQLRAVVDIFQAYGERHEPQALLENIAGAVKEALGVDVCTVLEYDSSAEQFAARGAVGLHYKAPYTPPDPEEFRRWFLDQPGPTLIPDVAQDERRRDSDFVQREDIKSTIVYPLRVEGEPLGLLFASYRYHKEPAPEEVEAIGHFADFAALVMHEARLREELTQTRGRLERRTFLTWVSMLEDTWRHSLVQKAAAIRNYTAVLQMRFEQRTKPVPNYEDIQEKIAEIDRLASEIAQTPVQVPQSWEMEPELFPLASLLEEIAQRERQQLPFLQAGPPVEIGAEVEALGGVQVRGYRRWLIYALESLLQNACKAMPQGGTVTISGLRAGEWAEIRIQDTGEGIPEPIRDRLFKERIPAGQDRAGIGIGGLLAATIIEEQGGSIEVEKPGPGDTTVLIRLPVAGEAEG